MIENKLPFIQAHALIREAHNDVRSVKGYRIGQAVYNRLPEALRNEIVGTELDMFQMTDSNQVAQILFDKLVDIGIPWM